MGNLLQDLRYGVRLLLKRPGFTAVAVLTLALGIGVNTAIFSLVNAVLLQPLPYPEPDRLTTFYVSSRGAGLRQMEWTEGQFAWLRERNHAFESLAAYDNWGFNLIDGGEPERLNGAIVTHDFFRVLGQQPLYGRAFLPEEDRPGNNNVLILSHHLWQRRFGGDPDILNKPLILDNTPTVVVGIMPPGFNFPENADLWVPVGLSPQDFSLYYIQPIARLKPGVSLKDAEREMAALIEEFGRLQNWPHDEEWPRPQVVPLVQSIVGEVRTPLLILLGAAGLVLLIACANIANLLLARAGSRTREIAIRCCLGASPSRIAMQMLTESLLLAFAGATGGLLLAFWCVEWLKRISPEEIPRIEQVQIDSVVLIFTVGVMLWTGILFGLAPALRAVRVNLLEATKEAVRNSASVSSRRMNNLFVILQFSLSLILLISVGLLLESFRHLVAVDPGFRPENVLTARVQLPNNKYADETQVRNFQAQLVRRVGELPGVGSAALCQMIPFGSGGDGNPFTVEGREPAPDEQLPEAWWRSVTPAYFDAMKITVIKGRAFLDTDNENSERVAIVDEKLARAYWPDGDAVGKRIRIGRASWGNPLMRIVGVVASVKHRNLDEDAKFYLYMPASQETQWSTYLVVRTLSDPEAIVSAVRGEVSALDPELPLFEVRTMEQAVARSLATRRLTNHLLTAFAATALLLAAVGIYGVMSLNVSNRTSEFGIRMALGAEPGNILRLVLGQGMTLAAIGLGAGLLATFWITPLLASLLYGVGETDFTTFAVAALILVGVALFACYIPARRATKVDPIIALRCE
ncbi:MAG TPA: ABC transporter permease [Blastocatellia bacterium]|nr:ABC transporter permease [Blastocatellia bacterium]